MIPEGTYSSYTALAAAVQVGLRAADATLTDASCAFDADTHKLTITLPSVSASSFLVVWQSRSARPAGVSQPGFFQQTHMILGCRPSRGAAPVNAFAAVGSGAMSAPYPCSLSSMDSIYLRSSLMGGHYQSIGHERFIPNNPNQIIESQIWARIPITTDANPIIYVDNGADMFQLNPQQRSLISLELFLTDEWGRSLAEVSPGQVGDGMLNFTATIRFDVLTPTKNHVGHILRKGALSGEINHVVAP